MKSNEPTKTKKAMKTIKFLSMAALALVGAVMTGCSNDDEIIETPQQPVNSQNVETLTTTVGFDEVAETRALTSGGVKTFAAGDQLALVYKNKSGQTVKTLSRALPSGDYGSSATFTFELVDADKTKDVTYIYPAAMAKADGTENYDALNSQNGTLATLASSLDLATFSDDWNGTSLPAGTLVNQLAVCALTLKDNATPTPNTITSGLTKVTVSDGSNTYTVTPTSSTFGENVIYVAIRPVTAALQYTATDGTKYYTKTATSREYAAGNFYNLGLRMVEPAATDLSMVDCAGNDRASRWTANCYMVHTAGKYKLPLVYGNAIKNGQANTAAYTGVSGSNTTATFPNHAGTAINAPWITKSTSGTGVNKGMGIAVTSAELLWQDAEGLITAVGIDGDYLTLTVGKDAATQEGNAVIAVKAGSTIVWSWHIWVTKQTFATLTTITASGYGYKVTPVNLGWVGEATSGATGYNTYYQWGRKDAFIPSTGTNTTNHTVYNISNATVTGFSYTNDNSVTIGGNIQQPTTFYSASYKPNTSTAYNLWDAQQTSTAIAAAATKKTVYDPCPPGFCVPTSGLYNYIASQTLPTTFSNGYTYSGVFFPASGWRGYSNGALSLVGTYGYCWSATPSDGTKGRKFYFCSSEWVFNDNYRTSGYPVRAVAE